jgi:hypothetical protein
MRARPRPRGWCLHPQLHIQRVHVLHVRPVSARCILEPRERHPEAADARGERLRDLRIERRLRLAGLDPRAAFARHCRHRKVHGRRRNPARRARAHSLPRRVERRVERARHRADRDGLAVQIAAAHHDDPSSRANRVLELPRLLAGPRGSWRRRGRSRHRTRVGRRRRCRRGADDRARRRRAGHENEHQLQVERALHGPGRLAFPTDSGSATVGSGGL